VTVMQKAVTPAMSQGYLRGGYDRVAGFVVRAADAAFATTPATLFEVHGLGFPGSPFTPDAPHVDVLRFPATPQLRFEDAVGGTDQESRQRTGGPFVDRPPFTGLGFAAVRGAIVPVYWLVHSRVPAGTELVRVAADGSQTLLARYADVGHGWVSDVVAIGHAPTPHVSRYVGALAQWQGAYLSADVLDDVVVVATDIEPPAHTRMERTAAGRWRRASPAAR
jgi:hypothetical protein